MQSTAWLNRWVYPRACGGTDGIRRRRIAGGGLSPRVRGNPFSDDSIWLRIRSIPARAGEPQSRGVASWNSEVYPRACGGTSQSPVFHYDVDGLSPRVRGNPLVAVGSGLRSGSIPARAGEPDSAP